MFSCATEILQWNNPKYCAVFEGKCVKEVKIDDIVKVDVNSLQPQDFLLEDEAPSKCYYIYLYCMLNLLI